MKIQASNEPEQSAMKKHPWMLPPKAIPRLQIPTARSTKVNEDLTVSLVRRMKLNFTFGCIEGFNGEGVDELNVKFFISNLFHNRQVFPRPLKVPYEDIHVHILSPFKKTTIDEDREMFVLADGCFYFRDKRLIFEQFLEGLRNYLLKYLSTYNTSGYGSTFQVTLTLPPEEDPNKMMASLSKIPQAAEPPTLIIKGLPQWVTEQQASMRIFFETFGVLRAFDVAHGEVSLQFENCYKALRLLCACSLHLESVVQGDTLVDYVLTWKEKRALEEEENLSFSPILKKPLLEPSATKNELEKHHGYQLEAGKVRKLNTKFQIGLVDHKHEEKTNDKDNFIQQLLMEKRNLEEKIVKLEKKKEKMGAKMKDFRILASKHTKGEKLALVWLIVSWILFSIVLYHK